MRRGRMLVLILLLVVLLAGCGAGPNTAAEAAANHDPAGFWLGLWHGLIAPITFIISLFNDNVNIYEVNNNGNWYNFGFVFGAGILFGGGGSRA